MKIWVKQGAVLALLLFVGGALFSLYAGEEHERRVLGFIEKHLFNDAE